MKVSQKKLSECQSISRVIKSISLKQKKAPSWYYEVVTRRRETARGIQFHLFIPPCHTELCCCSLYQLPSILSLSRSQLGCHATCFLCALSLEIFSVAAMALVLSKRRSGWNSHSTQYSNQQCKIQYKNINFNVSQSSHGERGSSSEALNGKIKIFHSFAKLCTR